MTFRRSQKPRTEVELAEHVTGWLQSLGYECFAEVEVPSTGRLDIAATMGPKLFAIECKKQLSWELLVQAMRWQKYAHLVAVAVPLAWGVERDLARRVLTHLGIGLIEVRGGSAPEVKLIVDPMPNHNPHSEEITSKLCPEHKTYAKAGSTGVPRWTEFKATMKRLEEYVQANPGVALSMATRAVQNHYKSRGSFAVAILDMTKKGVVKGIEVRRENGQEMLYPTNESEAA